MNWKIGTKLVCIDDWCVNPAVIMPKVGDIVTFDGICPAHPSCIFLAEYKRSLVGTIPVYESIQFRPLIGESAKDELINSFKEVIESPDCPVQIPQTT